MTQTTGIRPEIYLRRAVLLLKDIEEEIAALRREGDARGSPLQAGTPFPWNMVPAFDGSQNPKQHKSVLLLNIELARQEIANAERIDPEATIETFGGTLSGTDLRVMAACAAAKVEMAWGEAEEAKHLLQDALRMAESSNAHYLLGQLYKDEHKGRQALRHFERCLALDPDGEFSVLASLEADAMRTCRNGLRGRWLSLFVLSIFPALLLGGLVFVLSSLH